MFFFKRNIGSETVNVDIKAENHQFSRCHRSISDLEHNWDDLACSVEVQKSILWLKYLWITCTFLIKIQSTSSFGNGFAVLNLKLWCILSGFDCKFKTLSKHIFSLT